MAKPEPSGPLETQTLRGKLPQKGVQINATQRIDPPHEVNGMGPDLPEIPPGMVPPRPTIEVSTDEPIAKQIQFQAGQLANHLRTRQKELDAREAELNSWIAQFESEARAAHLWIEERETDLSARDEALARQQEECCQAEREAKRRLTRLAAAEAALLRRSSIEFPPCASDAAMPCAAPQLPVDEVRTARVQAEIEQLHEELLRRQKAFDDEAADARRRMAEEHAQAMADVERRREAVQRQSEHLDRSRATLQQLRDELGRVHRETLELRLAAEELWAQLSGVAPSAAITQSLGRIRAKLADQYRAANDELAAREKQLELAREELLEHHAKLVEQKQQFDAWIAVRQEECQQQAARLVAREQQLRHKELQFTSASPCRR